MSKKEEYFEVSMPKFVIPLVAILILGVVAFFVFSNNKEETKEESATLSGDFDVTLEIDTSEGAYLGNLENAKYAIVEFSDFQCSFCSRHASETLPEIEKELLGEDSEIVYFFREVAMYPPKSMSLSLLGQCIFEKNGLDEYRAFRSEAYGLSFEGDEDLLEKFEASSEVKDCFESKEYEERIENNWSMAQSANVEGVPGFLVGRISEDGKVDGFMISGAYPFSEFEAKLELLKY